MKNRAKPVYLIALLLAVCTILALTAVPSPSDTSSDSWPNYGRDAGGMRYSPVWKVQATLSWETLSRVICVSGE